MIGFFRRIRRKLANENRFLQYSRYAIGEIVLVMVGILLALQVNNWNENRIQRMVELKYLANITKDLNFNIKNLNDYIARRTGQINSAKNVIEYHDGKPLENLVEFNMDCINVYTWQKFILNHNTFQELVNSGNLTLISNDSIKNMLLDLEALNDNLKYTEEHFRFDAENLLYFTVFEYLDMYPTVESFMFHLSNGNLGNDVALPREDFEKIINSKKHKNGMAMAIYELGVMKTTFENMKDLANLLIEHIEIEIKKG